MITAEEFEILRSEEVQQLIEQNKDRDPLQIALNRHIPHARLVADQVKYRKRATHKLPRYAAAGCILPSLAFEQSSSELCAAQKPLRGTSVLDLTCGLGVDSSFLSAHFDRVVSLERNGLLAQIARENFRRLGLKNIEVIHSSSEDYLASCHTHFDWIYADPDRRGADGRKKVCLEDCSPNMIALMPRLKELANGICIKNSPLFDVEEAFRLFPSCRVEVISIGDECKEVVIYIDPKEPSEHLVEAIAIGKGCYRSSYFAPVPPRPDEFRASEYRYLILPDVALLKARKARESLAAKADIWSENGFGFALEKPTDCLGRIFRIERIMRYDPKALKRQFKGHKAQIFKRDCPISNEEVMARLGLRAGAELSLAITKIEDQTVLIVLGEELV